MKRKDEEMEVVLSRKLERLLFNSKKSIERILEDYFESNAPKEELIVEKIVEKMIELKTFTKMELRDAKIINQNDFKTFFDKHYRRIIELLADEGYCLIKTKGYKNLQKFEIIK